MLEIHIPVVNNPIFIELQYLTLNKFCKDEFKIVIFNDAKDWVDFSNFGDITLKQKIKDLCDSLNIEHHFVPNENHKINKFASDRHCQTANYIFQNFQKNNKNDILILDSDMFPIKEFSIQRYKEHDVAAVMQNRDNTDYFWPNLFYFKPNLLKDSFDWSILHNDKIQTDTGGKTGLYLLENKLNIYKMDHLISLKWNKNDVKLNDTLIHFLDNDVKNEKGKYYCEIYDDIFLHYRAGSNWEGLSKNIHYYRTLSLQKTLKKLCDN